jgi:tRNA-2-methylthio-N6-dimethylallyladenosine synthase
VGYVGAYSFAYSPRPGTPAADLPNQIDEVTKKVRLAALQAVLDAGTATFCKQFVGQTLKVLIEGPAREGPQYEGQLRARSAHGLPVNVVCPQDTDLMALVGQMANVSIERATERSLVGRLG